MKTLFSSRCNTEILHFRHWHFQSYKAYELGETFIDFVAEVWSYSSQKVSYRYITISAIKDTYTYSDNCIL